MVPSQSRPHPEERLAQVSRQFSTACHSSPFVTMRPTARFLNMATTALSVGQTLRGKASNYKILERLQKDRDVWAAM